jgi:hypothetical protein
MRHKKLKCSAKEIRFGNRKSDFKFSYFLGSNSSSEMEKHPVPSSTTLMKLSFDEDHRNTMCLLGAIHALADLIQV